MKPNRFVILTAFLTLCACSSEHIPPENRQGETNSFGDFSFDVPDNWVIARTDREKTKCSLLLNGTSWQNADAMIKVDVGRPAALSAKALAASFASDPSDRLSDEAINIDGEDGFIVTTASKSLNRPKKVIVVFRGDFSYLLMGAAKESIDLDPSIGTILKTWKWAATAN